MDFVTVILFFLHILICNGASLKEQLEHIASKRMESQGYNIDNLAQFRRLNAFTHGQNSLILGAPSMPSHLPEAEALLPGHTLIRPALGMLKSAVKFPHRDWENGSGVYGNVDSLGITWAGTGERVLYSGFRRNDNNLQTLSEKPKSIFIIILRRSNNNKKKEEKHYKAKQHSSSRDKKLPESHDAEYDMTKKRDKGSDDKSGRNAAKKYDDYQDKKLREVRRYEVVSSKESEQNTSSESEVEGIDAPKKVDPDPKLTWFLNSKDMYNNIKISPEAPEWAELMPASPADEDQKHWEYFHLGDTQDMRRNHKIIKM